MELGRERAKLAKEGVEVDGHLGSKTGEGISLVSVAATKSQPPSLTLSRSMGPHRPTILLAQV